MAETQTNRRLSPRRKIYLSCQVDCGDRQASGKIVDASARGVTIMLPESAESIKLETLIYISPARQSPDDSPEGITLRVRPVYLQKKSKGHRVGFKVEQIESGEPEWTRLCRELYQER